MNEQEKDILVKVDRLAVTFYTPRGTVRAVREASLEIRRGEVLGLVGESGCGKSTTAFAIMGYLPGTADVEGTVLFEGKNVAQMDTAELRGLRGNRMAMVYQDPALSLNPTMRVGPQVQEVLREHLGLDPGKTLQKSIDLFESVGLADPLSVGNRYPHQLSGGMQQRVVIAMALACDPDLLVMDEPTTGLDVTTEATILDLVVDLKDRVNAGILYVSHNLGVIARVADRVAVMYAGQTVEQAPVGELFKRPKHPYSTGLLSCVPQQPVDSDTIVKLSSIPGSVYPAAESTPNACLFAPRCPMTQDSCRNELPKMLDVSIAHQSRCFFWNDVNSTIWGEMKTREGDFRTPAEPVLSARNLRHFYGKWGRKYIAFGPRVRPPVRAVTDVDFDVMSARTLGIVGESGSGKTTVARAVVGLVARDRGKLWLQGEEIAPSVEDRSRAEQAAMRMVFQNPTASLNPKLPIRHTILRSLRKFAQLSKQESLERAEELLRDVGLDPVYLDRHPSELSGGEQQRVALAGAYSGSASIIVADEAVSALDVSVQAQVLNLLRDHQTKAGTSYMFISHDLGVVRYVSDDILVLYAGHVAEYGPSRSVLKPPFHPYTEALLSAAPVPDPDALPTRIRLQGAVPTLRERFQGCFFAGRCPRKIGPICDQTPPPARVGPRSPDHVIYCHIPVDELDNIQREQ
ncbi:dipeptide ABC transporter ATP-binding protein [Dehalococcoidia bacterium]|nr:dipeptide ABC transporter ATP-binding protein [Dehalococcoidia bacterium]